MAGSSGSILTAFTPTLVLLALQDVSDFMAGTIGFILSAFTPNPSYWLDSL